MPTVAGAKREREFRAHYINASLTPGGTANYVRIGKDNTSLARTINYDTTSEKNVIGETIVTSTRAGDTMDVSPYYVRKDEPLGELIHKIDVEELALDELRREYVEVFLDEDSIDSGTSEAFQQMADITPSSAGGDATAADGFEFTLTFSGKKIKGTWDISTKTFTPVSSI